MARINNNDWTDELREMIDGVELSPSEGGWEQLKADLHPRKAVWWPYAVPAAACLLLGGVFLFRGASSSESEFDVVSPVPSAMVADVVDPSAGGLSETQTDPTAKAISLEDASADETVRETTLTTVEIPDLASSAESVIENDDTRSLTTVVVSETVPPSATEEGGPLAVGSAKQMSSETTTVAEPKLISSFDFEDEPIARQRKQRRKITVTVSAGGAFGASRNGAYVAQAGPVTKAGGEVLDISEVIQHSTPVQRAVGLSIPISERLDIGTGLDHMELNSVVGPGSQNLEWIGVPVRLGYNIADIGMCSINLGAGFKGEKCLSANLLGMDYNEPFQWAANMGADCRVHLVGPLSLNLTPEFSYYFTETVLPTYRTDRPLTFTLRAGLSLNL